jgi:hypothetical protein
LSKEKFLAEHSDGRGVSHEGSGVRVEGCKVVEEEGSGDMGASEVGLDDAGQAEALEG